MTLHYIRQYYQVPAFRGAKIEFQGTPCIIVGSRGAYLRARDMNGRRYALHPTWAITYKEKSNV